MDQTCSCELTFTNDYPEGYIVLPGVPVHLELPYGLQLFLIIMIDNTSVTTYNVEVKG